MPLCLWFNHFLDAFRAEILQNFLLVFWKILDIKFSFWNYLTFNLCQVGNIEKRTEKRWVYCINVSNQKKKSEFAQPLFSNLKKIRVCWTTFLPLSKSLLRVQIKRLNREFRLYGWKVQGSKFWCWKVHAWNVWAWKVHGWKVGVEKFLLDLELKLKAWGWKVQVWNVLQSLRIALSALK